MKPNSFSRSCCALLIRKSRIRDLSARVEALLLAFERAHSSPGTGRRSHPPADSTSFCMVRLEGVGFRTAGASKEHRDSVELGSRTSPEDGPSAPAMGVRMRSRNVYDDVDGLRARMEVETAAHGHPKGTVVDAS